MITITPAEERQILEQRQKSEADRIKSEEDDLKERLLAEQILAARKLLESHNYKVTWKNPMNYEGAGF